MAVITPSSIVSEIRGSVGDQTYSKNRYGPYVKQKLTQPASSTTPQQTIRAAVQEANSNWQGLTPAVQKSFENYALENPRSKNISRKVRLAGFNEYVSRWLNMFVTGSFNSSFNAEPKLKAMVRITGITIDENEINVAWESNETLSNHWLVLTCSEATSSGVTSFNGRFHRTIVATQISGTSGTYNMFYDYVAIFPIIAADIGGKINVRASLISPLNWTRTGYSQEQFVITSDILAPIPEIVETQAASAAATTTVDITFSETLVADDLIVLFQFTQGNSSNNLVSGFTNLYNSNGGGIQARCSYQRLTGSISQTITVTCGTSANIFVIGVLIRKSSTSGFITLAGSGTSDGSATVVAPGSPLTLPPLSLALFFTGASGARTFSSIDEGFAEETNVKLTPGVPSDGWLFTQSTDIEISGLNPVATFTASTNNKSAVVYIE